MGLIRRWRLAAHRHLAHVPGLVHVLMKPRQGEAWTQADRVLLRRELSIVARWTPGLLLFLLPGGLLLLPAYAWLLDRRRARREGPQPLTRVSPPRDGGAAGG